LITVGLLRVTLFLLDLIDGAELPGCEYQMALINMLTISVTATMSVSLNSYLVRQMVSTLRS